MTRPLVSEAQSKRWVHGVIPDAEHRPKDDFYPTPPHALESLLAVEDISGSVWEPACGDGALSKVLEARGHDVLSTDLVDRGFGVPRVDFLMEFNAPRRDWIITNPPFKLGEEFLHRALDRSTVGVALLCRLAWLEGKARRKIFESTPLAAVHVFSARLKIYRNGDATAHGGGLIAFAWYVWRHAHTGKPTLGWI